MSLQTALAQNQPPLDHLLPALTSVGIKTVAYLRGTLVDPLDRLKNDDFWKHQLDAGTIELAELYMLQRLASSC
jgi:hypothetical protein